MYTCLPRPPIKTHAIAKFVLFSRKCKCNMRTFQWKSVRRVSFLLRSNWRNDLEWCLRPHPLGPNRIGLKKLVSHSVTRLDKFIAIQVTFYLTNFHLSRQFQHMAFSGFRSSWWGYFRLSNRTLFRYFWPLFPKI